MAASHPRHGLAGLLVLLLCSGVRAYPALFVARYAKSCTSHPESALMGGRGSGHMAPIKDEATTLQVLLGGKAVTKLCPGSAHAVRVSFPIPRFGLLTASAGEFAEGDPWDCPNRVVLDKARQEDFEEALKVPCSGSSSIELRVTSSNGERRSFEQTGLTLQVDSSCAAAACNSGKSG
ncbi:hypothetical protein Rsub_05762 [Raphidocelis subcapitata]|uniref:Pherophorin domain-containing protein n=1 Tax=Raphidocelis subcapitata TaxID=307507 RepID=A0A2V0NZ82_9CHLO|nr:hypothetical protein Rsub_05762 [Raphidocelis subcapitata]|eukprot:GBF92926.1 hypothetical protein Rsub_05762 [Raphidocelis subcapitata]